MQKKKFIFVYSIVVSHTLRANGHWRPITDQCPRAPNILISVGARFSGALDILILRAPRPRASPFSWS